MFWPLHAKSAKMLSNNNYRAPCVFSRLESGCCDLNGGRASLRLTNLDASFIYIVMCFLRDHDHAAGSPLVSSSMHSL